MTTPTPSPDQKACREAFENRRVPNLDLKRRADGGYLYEVAQSAFCDFADGWQAHSARLSDPKVVEVVAMAIRLTPKKKIPFGESGHAWVWKRDNEAEAQAALAALKGVV